MFSKPQRHLRNVKNWSTINQPVPHHSPPITKPQKKRNKGKFHTSAIRATHNFLRTTDCVSPARKKITSSAARCSRVIKVCTERKSAHRAVNFARKMNLSWVILYNTLPAYAPPTLVMRQRGLHISVSLFPSHTRNRNEISRLDRKCVCFKRRARNEYYELIGIAAWNSPGKLIFLQNFCDELCILFHARLLCLKFSLHLRKETAWRWNVLACFRKSRICLTMIYSYKIESFIV